MNESITWATGSAPIARDAAVCKRLAQVPVHVKSAHQLSRLKEEAKDVRLIGWGYRPSTVQVRLWAEKHQVSFYQMEEGFISYLGHPALGDKRFSVILDKQGIYYDARQRCDLDDMLVDLVLSVEQRQRAKNLQAFLISHAISKYNHLPRVPIRELENYRQSFDGKIILLIDQVVGDASIVGALADENDFRKLLDAALEQNPDACFLVKVHPDVLLGKKRGYLHALLNEYPGLMVADNKIPAAQLLGIVDAVYTVSSQLGFEALMHGKPVHCFGMPFYAGRGLTNDYKLPSYDRVKVELDALIYAVFFEYCSYIDPETGDSCELESLLYLLAEQLIPRKQYQNLYAIGFSLWKRLFLRSWLDKLSQQFYFLKSSKRLPLSMSEKDGILVWGNNHQELDSQYDITRLEDGLIRSKGLGIDLHVPMSLIFDDAGLYFDARKPSGIEQLLETRDLTMDEIERGRNLCELIKKKSITKYNLGGDALPDLRKLSSDKLILLVVGQVDNDASIRFGFPGNANISIKQMLQNIRQERKDAFIIYRPHPDVLTGERDGLRAEEARQWADYIDIGSDIVKLIQAVDEVHVLSSLTGFEALIYEKAVFCYGLPFYAGWGLTQDKIKVDRRNKRRSLNELVYLALVEYPLYIHPNTHRFTTVERVISYIEYQKVNVDTGIGFFRRLVKKAVLLTELLSKVK